jgi:thymidylate kinase
MIRLITISGLDGSGKSTQVAMLSKHFEKQNLRVYYFHAVKFAFANRVMGIFRDSTEDATDTGTVKAGKLTIFLRKLLIRLDVWRFKKLRHRLDKLGFDIIISDRYFYDSVINISYLEDNESFLNIKIPKPNIAVYMRMKPKSILERERAVYQGGEYLKDKYALYESYFSLRSKAHIVDASRGISEVFKDVLSVSE